MNLFFGEVVQVMVAQKTGWQPPLPSMRAYLLMQSFQSIHLSRR